MSGANSIAPNNKSRKKSDTKFVEKWSKLSNLNISFK